MILDSTFINDLVRGDDAATDKLDELIENGDPVSLPSLTVFEVGIGLRGDAAKHQTKFDNVVEKLDVASLGRREAETALDIQHGLYDRGEPIGAVDVLIAGIAAEQDDARVLTRNVDEFERVDAIRVETY
jgi:predicted nucleic acid-binding protein